MEPFTEPHGLRAIGAAVVYSIEANRPSAKRGNMMPFLMPAALISSRVRDRESEDQHCNEAI